MFLASFGRDGVPPCSLGESRNRARPSRGLSLGVPQARTKWGRKQGAGRSDGLLWTRGRGAGVRRRPHRLAFCDGEKEDQEEKRPFQVLFSKPARTTRSHSGAAPAAEQLPARPNFGFTVPVVKGFADSNRPRCGSRGRTPTAMLLRGAQR